MKCLVLLSSGLDSAANLAFAKQAGLEVSTITFDYGQRAAAREIENSEKLNRFFGVKGQVVQVPYFKYFQNAGALINSKSEMPNPSTEDLDSEDRSLDSAARVWVPNRNGVFLEIAAGFAESRQIPEILIGFNREEAATFPDNSLAYMDAINRALYFSTQNRVKVNSYTVHLNKTEILKKVPRPFPIDLVWSCYEAFEKPCGVCESCKRLTRALKESGILA